MLRLVLSDLQNICLTFIAHLDRGEYDLAQFIVLELLDKCVRRDSGGELGRYC